MWETIKHAIASIAIADVLSNEKIGEPVRERFDIKHRDNGDSYSYNPDSFMSSMLYCVFCTSYWTSGVLAVIRFISKSLYNFVTLVFIGAWLGGYLFRIRQRYF